MEAAAKRVRAGGGSAPDRLSTLPDELLRGVLSFLPARQVVQTAVLAKRWTDLWRSVPTINLDYMDFGSLDNLPNARCEKMKDFAADLLMLHNAECLDAFRLYFSSVHADTRDVDRWIRRASKYHPLVLVIHDNCWPLPYQIPRFGGTLRRLKKLELSYLKLGHSFGELLHSGCPVLEDLDLINCHNEFPGIVESDTLKSLVIAYCSSQVADTLIIRAPCLASLSLDILHHGYRNGVSLDTGISLVKASISFTGPVDQLSSKSQATILGKLFNVTSLELTYFLAMAMLDKELSFDNLRTLSLNCCLLGNCDVHKFNALGRFLQKSPNLGKLALRNFQVEPVVGHVESHMLESLRTLTLDKCNLHENFMLLRNCLHSSPNLEKLAIRCCELSEGSTRFRNVVCFECPKLKSSVIKYKVYDHIPELVCFLLGISGSAPNNTITLTKVRSFSL